MVEGQKAGDLSSVSDAAVDAVNGLGQVSPPQDATLVKQEHSGSSFLVRPVLGQRAAWPVWGVLGSTRPVSTAFLEEPSLSDARWALVSAELLASAPRAGCLTRPSLG